MKNYKKPELEITEFEINDVITASYATDIDYKSVSYPSGWSRDVVNSETSLFSDDWK